MLMLGGCNLLDCGDEVTQRESRPDARGAAVVYVRNCGATTDYSTQVALIRHVDAPPRDGEVLFVVDGDHGAAPAGPGGGPVVRIRWIDVNHLEIAHDPRARTFRHESAQGALRVTYVPLP
ncbi:hypothetical protein [Longimicrobium sp.]|uniref:hypothetical protein n=1 Tax=Longimicrobium sp. TaxID=2029185 RepID=UPI002E31D278|nr:hypothetical protein [Longimicrobium sp.]HEX6039189.1 hypothetical protein [Longimicrobium sp.]